MQSVTRPAVHVTKGNGFGFLEEEKKKKKRKKKKEMLTVVVAEHDTLWVTGGAAGVDQSAAVSRLLTVNSLFQLRIEFLAFSELHEGLPRVHAGV